MFYDTIYNAVAGEGIDGQLMGPIIQLATSRMIELTDMAGNAGHKIKVLHDKVDSDEPHVKENLRRLKAARGALICREPPIALINSINSVDAPGSTQKVISHPPSTKCEAFVLLPSFEAPSVNRTDSWFRRARYPHSRPTRFLPKTSPRKPKDPRWTL